MIQSIILVIFILSLVGALSILALKIPLLNLLPRNGSAGIREHHFVLNIENKIKDILLLIEKQIFLHKLLSWIKVVTLKIETKVDHLLHGIRKKAQQIDKKIENRK
jgi:hypothetical protein